MWLRNMPKFKFSYDEDTDDLFLFNPKSKSKGSVELGNLILDYNTKKELVGLQIMNASRFIKTIRDGESIGMIKKILANLQDCKIFAKAKNNMLTIRIYLISKIKDIEPINVSVPSITESSPALAAA